MWLLVLCAYIFVILIPDTCWIICSWLCLSWKACHCNARHCISLKLGASFTFLLVFYSSEWGSEERSWKAQDCHWGNNKPLWVIQLGNEPNAIFPINLFSISTTTRTCQSSKHAVSTICTFAAQYASSASSPNTFPFVLGTYEKWSTWSITGAWYQ